MAIKKTQLYKHLWEAANTLRGGMDASQYKDYVLTILFVKYVTDRYKNDPYAAFVVPDGGSFDDLIEAKEKADIGERINKVLARLAEENDLSGIINHVDFDDDTKLGKGKEKIDRLTKLIAIFENPELNFAGNRADGDDILGDVYEYFMKQFATEAGKSKGQFYTPAEVSRIMAQIIGVEKVTSPEQSVYDPTCGSGSLLLKVAETAKDNTQIEMSIYGQEIDIDVANLAKMNMIMHGFPAAEIEQGNTLSDPKFKEKDGNSLKTFNFAVSNPPFSQKNWMNGLNPEDDKYRRFELGIPPAKNGDYAFLLHLLKSLKPKGKGAIILPHGVLFRGNAEAVIRRNLILRGYIKAIIGLPANLFYGTGIPAVILVLDKENAAARKGIYIIDASKGYRKDGAKNRLRERDIHKIVTAFQQKQEIPGYARMVSVDEIKENEYNLNIPRYIDNTEEEDIQDIYAHLHGGIPHRDIERLEALQVFPGLKKELLADTGQNYYRLQVALEDLQAYIENHREIRNFQEQSLQIFEQWAQANRSLLYAIDSQTRIKELIRRFSETLLEAYRRQPVTDAYAMYQALMDYWDEEMKDDVYMIMERGWLKSYRITVVNKKGKKTNKGWDCDLLPKEIVAGKYFAEDRQKLENLQNQLDSIETDLEELIEENSGEDGIFEEVKNDKGKVVKAGVKNKIKELKNKPGFEEEVQLLNRYLHLSEEISRLKKQIKAREQELDKKLLEKYQELTEDEIKKLLVEDKWFARIRRGIDDETEDAVIRLAMRIKELAERYAEPLPEINRQVQELEQKVRKHLQQMGYTWE